MLVKEVLHTTFDPLKSTDTVSDALNRMDELDVNTLPVVDDTTHKLVGQIAIKQLKKGEDDATIADIELNEAVKVYSSQHIFEAVRLMLQYEMRLLPVVDKEWTLLGTVDKSTVLESLTKMLNLAEFGSIITIKLKERDFTISEIVHIIETEGAKILGITVETPGTGEEIFEVSVKLNVKDVSRVASALRRYGYTVVTDSSDEVYGMDIETRADELLKYLDM